MNTTKNLLLLALALTLPLAGARAATFTSNTTLGVGDTTYDGQSIIVSNCTLTVDGPHSFAKLVVTNGGSLTHSPWSAGLTNNRLELTIAGDVFVTGGSAIRGNASLHVTGAFTLATNATFSADAKGYPVGDDGGPGVGGQSPWRGGGGGHGGLGGAGRSDAGPAPGGEAYGDPLAPTALGSRGGHGLYGPGAPGGGAIRLVVGGTLTVDGVLSANGGNAGDTRSGGGSGGSIWITTSTLGGTGLISANGGNGNSSFGGGAGGGRIAVEMGSGTYIGVFTTTAGNGAQRGGAGTVFLRLGGAAAGVLAASNGGVAGVATPLSFAGGVNTLIVDAGAIVIPDEPLVLTNLIIGNDGTLTHRAAQAGVFVTALNDASVSAGGKILADGLGHFSPTNAGPGAGAFLQLPNGQWSAGGAGHGALGGAGYTGAAGGGAYGSITTPTNHGSLGGVGLEGPGGAGGGTIRLIAGNRLTVDGTISANGLNAVANNSGGGSGGCLWLTVGTLAGSGTITANGGRGEASDGGSGAGGRVAIEYATNIFTGTLAASGGPGRYGGLGTVFLRGAGDAAGALRLDGGGLGSFPPATPISGTEPLHLAVSNFALATFPGPATLASLTVGLNGRVTVPSNGVPLDLVVLGDATIAPGGQVRVDGLGCPIAGDAGPGAGSITNHGGSGAGHGGGGGASWTGARGGRPYGSATDPVTFGSQGGPSLEGSGGAGGGAVRMTVGGILTIEGQLSANGLNAVANNSGGGAGGSVLLAVGGLAGGGAVQAQGGVGEFHEGGGGGGGRIAIHGELGAFNPNNLSVTGGGGFATGTNGTVHLAGHVMPRIVAHRPATFVIQAPDFFEVDFDQGIDPLSFTPGLIQVSGPSGAIPTAQLGVFNVGGRTWRVTFPPQTSNGRVSFTIAPGVRSLFGLTSTTPYSGGFDIWLERYLLVRRAGNTLRLDWATSPDRTYQLQSSTTLSGWADLGPAWPGTGSFMGTNITMSGPAASFFRLRITD